MKITHQKSTLLRGAGGLAAAIGAASIAFGAFATSAAAGGNPNFEGILSAAAPTGFMSSPLAYDVSGGPVTVDFDVVVTNLTAVTQSVGLNFSADHILTYNGVDVSDGQPGQPGITFTGPSGTTQVAMPGTQSFTTDLERRPGRQPGPAVQPGQLRVLPARHLGADERRLRRLGPARPGDPRLRIHQGARVQRRRLGEPHALADRHAEPERLRPADVHRQPDAVA